MLFVTVNTKRIIKNILKKMKEYVGLYISKQKKHRNRIALATI